MHAAFARLSERLRPDALVYPGHEYTVMLLQMACRREPGNLQAQVLPPSPRSTPLIAFFHLCFFPPASPAQEHADATLHLGAGANS